MSLSGIRDPDGDPYLILDLMLNLPMPFSSLIPHIATLNRKNNLHSGLSISLS